ncbi:right-handed parallel beta-helix repeat-containing protein [Methanolobus halotolerans]|uniref:Carbohydrate-binding/sugar hydrolysis domain-containing protein n=1 Tax=Methanolobus halotolerans TaxID=2052935 RepID=A0A4E0PVJ2_9EURY|nr:right-handed parallel beta-helix repeat-containing protein [Methanolobus halotolerans]TGC09159.1 hypothetical protein CUN85_07260 [Methanolobus halotolerans]
MITMKTHFFRYSFILLLLLACANASSAADLLVGSDQRYANISSALANANNNDVIIVGDGFYQENLVIGKEVKILSENGSSNTFIQPAFPDEHIFNITTSNITISGFNITGATNAKAVYIFSAANCNISNNEISASDKGIYTEDSTDGILRNNTIHSNYMGITLYNSTDFTLKNNTMTSNDYNFGIISSFPECYVHNVAISNRVDGKKIYYLTDEANYIVPSDAGQVYAVNSSGITVKDIAVSNCLDGVAFVNTSNSEIRNVTVSDTDTGIFSLKSDFNLIYNVTAGTNSIGIGLYRSGNNILANSTSTNNSRHGIEVSFESSNNTLANSTTNNNRIGIYLSDGSENNTLADNTVNDNKGNGISSLDCDNNLLINNSVSNNSISGMYIIFSDNTVLTNNSASKNKKGIFIRSSKNNTMIHNIMTLNDLNFGIDVLPYAEYMLPYAEYIHDINTSNKVDGKRIYYLIDEADYIVPSDAGQIYAINSTNVTIRDISISNAISGVTLVGTNNSYIDNVTISDCDDGIYFRDADKSSIGNVTISDCDDGIYFRGADKSSIDNVTISGGYSGIYFRDADKSSIDNVTISDCDDGICFWESENNSMTNSSLYENRFYGIYVVDSDNNEFIGNIINNDNRDISYYKDIIFYNSDNNTVDKIALAENRQQISFTSDNKSLSMKGADSNSVTLSGKTNLNGYVKINCDSSNLNLTYYYDDLGISATEESSIILYRLSGSEWTKVSDTILDTDTNYVLVNLTEFGTFGLFRDASSSPESVSESEHSNSDDSSLAARTRSQGTVADLPVNSNGEILRDTIIKSSDATTALSISKGTKAVDPQGNPVNKIIVTTPSSLPADTPAEVVQSGLYYDFGPDGTTFSRDIGISIEFDPDDFKNRIPVICTYTSDDGWIALETSADRNNGRATAMISHFSLYALFGEDAGTGSQTILAESAKENISYLHETADEEAVEDKNGFVYLYWITGIAIILIVGILLIKRKKSEGDF